MDQQKQTQRQNFISKIKNFSDQYQTRKELVNQNNTSEQISNTNNPNMNEINNPNMNEINQKNNNQQVSLQIETANNENKKISNIEQIGNRMTKFQQQFVNQKEIVQINSDQNQPQDNQQFSLQTTINNYFYRSSDTPSESTLDYIQNSLKPWTELKQYKLYNQYEEISTDIQNYKDTIKYVGIFIGGVIIFQTAYGKIQMARNVIYGFKSIQNMFGYKNMFSNFPIKNINNAIKESTKQYQFDSGIYEDKVIQISKKFVESKYIFVNDENYKNDLKTNNQADYQIKEEIIQQIKKISQNNDKIQDLLRKIDEINNQFNLNIIENNQNEIQKLLTEKNLQIQKIQQEISFYIDESSKQEEFIKQLRQK